VNDQDVLDLIRWGSDGGPPPGKRQRSEAYRLGCQHGRAGDAPFGDLWDVGSADLMTALGETDDTTDANYEQRVSLLDAYRRGWEKTSGRDYQAVVAS